MKKPKKKDKHQSEKNFSPEKDDFDNLSERAFAGDTKSMMLLLAKHGNMGYELSDSEIEELFK